MPFWTDVIAYSPAWVDVYPEKVRRFIGGIAGGSIQGAVVRVAEPEVSCYGVHDEKGQARKTAAAADLDALLAKLVAQAKRFEELDCEATGVFEPPAWTEDSDLHVGAHFLAEGAVSKVCKALSSAVQTPFAELELTGLRVPEPVRKAMSLLGEVDYLDLAELNFEVGPNFVRFMDDPPEFAGWLRMTLSGEGQPYPLGKEQLLDRARTCQPLLDILQYADECFGVKLWHWTLSCSG